MGPRGRSMANYIAVGDASVLDNPPTGPTATAPASADMLSSLQNQLNRFADPAAASAFRMFDGPLPVTGQLDGGVTAQRAAQVVAKYWGETPTLESALNATQALAYSGMQPDAWLTANMSSILTIVTGYADAHGLPAAPMDWTTPLLILGVGGLLWAILGGGR